jgi:hypothetical protein
MSLPSFTIGEIAPPVAALHGSTSAMLFMATRRAILALFRAVSSARRELITQGTLRSDQWTSQLF